MPAREKNALTIIKRKYLSMSEVERRIADFILEQPRATLLITARSLAETASVSEGSIINFAKGLGFSGFSEMKINLAQNLESVNNFVLRRNEANAGYASEIEMVADYYIDTCRLVSGIINPEDINRAAELILGAKQRVEIYGAGMCEPIVKDAQYWLACIGVFAVTRTEMPLSLMAASMLTPDSVVVAISHSGRSIPIIKSVETARERGAKIIVLTYYDKSPLAKLGDVVLVMASSEAESGPFISLSRVATHLIIDAICSRIASIKNIEFLSKTAEASDLLESQLEPVADGQRGFSGE